MAPRSCAQRSFCNNPLANLTEEQDKFASLQGLAKRSDAGSNKAFIPPKASTLLLVPLTEDLFTKFMKAFVESIQAQDQEQAEPRERPFKTRSPKTHLGKSHTDCYHFCQQ